VLPWGPPSGLGHNLQIPEVQVQGSRNTKNPKYKFLWTSTYKNAFQTSEVLQPYFKSSKGISRTSLRCGILTGFAIKIFSYDSLNSRKQLIHTDKLRTRATFMCPQPRIPLFWFTSSGVHKQPVLFEILAPALFILWGSHVQRQYRKWTTLRSESSTIKGLLYAPEPHNREKGTLSDQPQLSRVSSTALLCCWGCSHSKIWCPLWLTLRRMPYGRGTLKILLRRIFVARNACTIALSKAQGSCHKTSDNQP
jgi:hypothetical protein